MGDPRSVEVVAGASSPVIALSLQGVSVAFGGLKAVNDVSFDVPTGGIAGLIGPNGAGKTTIFNAISGVYRPSAGRIVVSGGRDLVGRKPFQVVACGIARTFQNLRLFRRLTVMDHLLLALDRDKKLSETAKLESGRRLLEIFNLVPRSGELAAELPYGDQRRLEIARALATGARVLLLDEPAAGMNPQETAALMDTVRVIRERFKATVLLIEHDMKLVMGVCEKIVVLDHGVKIAEGLPSEVRGNPAVIEAYLGKGAAKA